MSHSYCRILITGANGFIGKNLIVRLNERLDVSVTTFVRGDELSSLPKLVSKTDVVVHLAGENRPLNEASFDQVNAGLTSSLCHAIEQQYKINGRHIPLVLASSVQVGLDNAYGRSKLAAEASVQALAKATGNPCVIFRLPGVFGKWCRPNYNSVVATFCHNLAHDLPIQVVNPAHIVHLVFVDDVVSALLSALDSPTLGCIQAQVGPEYSVTLSELANQIRAFSACRSTLMSERVGMGLVRALYATYVSYLPIEKFSYELKKNVDPRGVFVEILKTPDCGQFSFFTAHPGITRGGHYHHTKSEKFLVIKGEALFRFRHLLTNELVELRTGGDTPQVVDTIPGWTHDITNAGNEEMVVMLWANENFDRGNPDTYSCNVQQ